jgi:hypothetical protein
LMISFLDIPWISYARPYIKKSKHLLVTYIFQSPLLLRMIRQLIILLFLLSKVNANWPFAYNEAYIHLHQVVCPNFFQIFVLAEKYGVQKVTHPPPNIFASLNYGFYELFICNSNGQHLSSGCVQEICKLYKSNLEKAIRISRNITLSGVKSFFDVVILSLYSERIGEFDE